MTSFDLEAHLKPLYARFEGKRGPVIGITANYVDGDATLRERYYAQVAAAGGVPMIIPPVADRAVLEGTLDQIDGLLLTGGGDINPLWGGEEPSPDLHGINATRDLPELLLTRLAYNRQIPILGICRGMQTLAMALGGKVAQDIKSLPPSPSQGEGEARAVMEQQVLPRIMRTQNGDRSEPLPRIKHSQDADRSEPTHTIHIVPGSYLAEIYGVGSSSSISGVGTMAAKGEGSVTSPVAGEQAKTGAVAPSATADTHEKMGVGTPPPIGGDRGEAVVLFVNSFHHQAVCDPGKRFRITAMAPDGIVEAMESSEFKPIMGVQWHPEWMGEEGQQLFAWLVKHARNFREAKQLHSRMLTLDSHCDTPMFFPQGVNFDRRDPRILYDLHKMHEGRQDAVVMVAYLPQPREGEMFSQKVDIAGIIRHNPHLAGISEQLSPTAYADLIFDKIEEIVARNSLYLGIARTPNELYENKRKGRKSIMLGIENGLALNHDPENVAHFARRGVVYITLCHNGDNDICDSARGSSMHNGVSAFGEKVIQRMNDEGIMVDLSHAAEQSFYDALDISRTPVVCSHSNCRALCDVPRNLTDDQLRALARKGGVAQITLYHGFLQKQGEATVMDALAHLEHAIGIMGIDHVGIGTDFDGDGTVRGCADASELINFTRHLLLRKYSEQDIAKIWGGNWLRVMSLTQNERK